MIKEFAVLIGVRAGLSILAALAVFFFTFSFFLAVIAMAVTPFVTKAPSKWIADLIVKGDNAKPAETSTETK